ncbi:DNA repair protein complementing XP-C cells like protein [Habropoda laboriosa]|uniref:DNA repair protein complementing XP-C cells like protein n=1 Tax=Habropoda laboriosa TaxID=597456 RepID=A0A0L7RAY8_9HYME|nr:PREDICTED: DNA repair protein complementing XP-C cells homolog [Habropoda laboriosa]KOC67990.1 DNA repair protein complementing XP-C cells like protein [Habropoda laboriosa]
MNGLSEEDSSDSSSEYSVDPDKIKPSSSFFIEKKAKVTKAASKSDSENESTDDTELEDASQGNNIELFTQVLKNLEYSQKLEVKDENVEKKQSFSDSSISQKEKEKAQKMKIEVNATSSFNEIEELLLQGETSVSSPSKKGVGAVTLKNEKDTEVPTEYTIPEDGVKIILPGTSVMLNRRKKGGQDLKAILRKRLRASQILVEKVGLLCWLAYGFNLNHQINQPEIMSGVLSLISTCNYPKNRIDLSYLEKFTKWFKNVFTFEAIESSGNGRIDKETLLKILQEKKISNYKELVLLYIATLRALGLNCRLVISLCPPHRAFSDDPLFKVVTKGQETESKSRSKGQTSKRNKEKEKKASDKTLVQNGSEAKKNANIEAKKRAAEILHSKSQRKAKKYKSDTKEDSKAENEETKQSNAKSKEKKNEPKVVEQEKSLSSLRQLRYRKVNGNSEDNKAIQSTDPSSKSDGTKIKNYIEEDSTTDSDSEFQPKSKNLAKKYWNDDKKEVPKHSKNVKKNNKKLISSDSEDNETNKTKKTQNIWAEIYLESEESWICASVMDEKIHCVTEVYKKAEKPVLYVVAWNSESLIKDVTRRYCPHWLTITRKQRIDEKWWLETLSYWKEKDTVISKAENEMLLQRELEQPLPKTIGECKGHPLYVIVRHLLKFEALYPPDCVPLGHTNTGEAIYSRHCVHTLCSRETWLKKARVVKPNQEPYKIVKARPKYDKLSGMKIKDSALEIFGEWQTMEYEPPVAKDGIVPRNEYGNVDLFKQCMLPKGTVHINLPALNRIARKLNIDCAPAVVGFNFGSMGAVPALEGYVVCTEYEDTLREAWEAEQVEAIKRAKEKQEKRVYGNWKRLIHGLLIRERLIAKYQFSKEIKTVANKRTKHKNTDVKKSKVS